MLFIDANQYLELYRTVSGKRLLPALDEQKENIFVTTQVVNEVFRNKVKVAADFLAEQLKKVNAVPDNYLSQEKKEEFRKQSLVLLEQISQSKDDVSKALAGIFDEAVPPRDEELKRARVRKAHGNPPGKKSGPLGDELSWEQILSKYEETHRFWIITSDSDFATEHKGKMFLNAALYRELDRPQSPPVVFCFDNIDEGIRHFAATVKVEAKKLPTPKEAEQIKKEQESLPPLGWLTDSDDGGLSVIQNLYRARESEMLRAALASQLASEQVFFPFEPEDEGKKK